ncbi:hypothetical protein [Parafrigoribacterium mesophilum]|uniref:hypothetical protein n=1 Tax=Parafrigoribacterium mesophilum TaxID=433646 RepID=UPI0031FCBBF8
MTQVDRDAEAELVELREAVLDDWIFVTSRVSGALRAMQHTLSWRITRPLRVFRKFSYKAREVGVVDAGQLAAVALARRFGLHR